MAKDDYNRQLDQLKKTDGVTDEDVKTFEQAAIIVKSIDYVKANAEHLAQMRSPARYKQVKSKIARNLKVAKKVAKKKRSPKKEADINAHIYNESDEELDENPLDGSIYSSAKKPNAADRSVDNISKKQSPAPKQQSA